MLSIVSRKVAFIPTHKGMGFSAPKNYKILETAPVFNVPNFNPDWIYRECQKIDEWAEFPHDGTSVRALFKILTREGYISGYNWAFKVSAVVDYVLNVGPMVIGSVWTEDMMHPDSNGYIHVGSGKLADVHSGHAYLIKGVNLDSKCSDGTTGAFRIINSWGSSWGVNGCASISIEDMAKLFKEYAEGCAAKEVIRKV